MTKQIEIPVGLVAVTPDWLSEVLQRVGSINQTRVKSFKREKMGGMGFTGQLARFKLDYTLVEENIPTSLIAKFSNSDPGLRASFHKVGFYEKEIRFYQELAPKTHLPTPHCYYGDIDLETGHSILLLEDLAHLRTIDISIGCNSKEAELVIRHLAEFHAHWWNSPQLQTSSYVPPLDHLVKTWHELYQGGWPQFPKKLEALLPEYQLPKAFLKLGDRFCHKPGNIFTPLTQSPITLTHMDIHLDNIFFGVHENDESLVVFDWQTYGYGRGIIDVTYFIISAVPVPLRRKAEKSLLQAYHSPLVQNGVQGYTFEQCWSEYLQAFFWNLIILTGVVMADMPHPESRRYIETALTRIIAFNEDHALDEYL